MAAAQPLFLMMAFLTPSSSPQASSHPTLVCSEKDDTGVRQELCKLHTVRITHCTLHTIHTVRIAHCTVCTLHTMYTVHNTLHSLYTTHCTYGTNQQRWGRS